MPRGNLTRACDSHRPFNEGENAFMISMLNRCLRVPAWLARLSSAAVVGWALVSGAHLLAVSNGSSNAPAEPTTQLAEADASPELLDGSPALERFTRAIAFAPCAANATLDCGTLTVPIDYRKPF